MTMYYINGGYGGSGGDWGASGATGGGALITPTQTPWYNAPFGIGYSPGASGGAGGKAINVNGYSLSIPAGNNGSQIKGAVS